jgi:hypothetical protein
VSDDGTTARGSRLTIWLLIVAGLVAIGMANWHLVYVAITSQPDCVAHARLGDGHKEHGSFSAAQSSCSP